MACRTSPTPAGFEVPTSATTVMPARRGVVESLVPENLRWEEGFPVEETTVWSLSEKTENPRTPATRVPVGVFTENEKFADVRVLETSSRVPWYQ